MVNTDIYLRVSVPKFCLRANFPWAGHVSFFFAFFLVKIDTVNEIKKLASSLNSQWSP